MYFQLALLVTCLVFGIQCSEYEPTLRSGCKLPEYAEDEHCDMENNNAACKWDGGACCKSTNDYIHWDHYCKPNCECLDPNAGQKGKPKPKPKPTKPSKPEKPTKIKHNNDHDHDDHEAQFDQRDSYTKLLRRS